MMGDSDNQNTGLVDQEADDYTDLSNVIDNLSKLTPVTEEYEAAAQIVLDDKSMIDKLHNLLSDPASGDCRGAVLSAKLVAELAKAECVRLALYDKGFIPLIVPFISAEDTELCLQGIRALGNMCYEQDTCREKILAENGLARLDTLLKMFVNKPVTPLDLKSVCCGFIHNFLNGNEACLKAVLNRTDIVQSLKAVLERNATTSPTIVNFCTMTFTSIAEVEGGREALYKHGIVPVLLKLLMNTPIRETDEVLLELISTLTSDSDDVKKLLAESTVDMYLLGIVSLLASSKEESDEQLVKSASELIVLVLTGDEAMNIWFDGGDGYVFASISEWLKSTNGQLLQSAAFAIGNFARDDKNSDIIIQRGISTELYQCLDQLKSFCNDARTAPTIHAVLSALRNLAIAPSNKEQLLEQGIMSHVLPYMHSDNSIVTSKVVGVLRLLIDKKDKEATDLGLNETILKKLVLFGNTDANMLLKGESTRCLAWIIKNSRHPKVLQNMLNVGAFKHLVFLINSEHPIMQNEGLISIVLLVSNIPEETGQLIRESSLHTSLIQMLNKDELPAKEVIQNILTLFLELVKIDFVEQLIESQIHPCIENLSGRVEEQTTLNVLTSLRESLGRTTGEGLHQSKP